MNGATAEAIVIKDNLIVQSESRMATTNRCGCSAI